MTLAAVDFQQPMTWAILIGWIMSVVLHEFAHGLVAFLGGDYTIKERGGLTLNPLQYIDPVMSILLPAVFLMLGGIPLPGGVTYIRHDLLRSRLWESAVAAAGPAMNFILFLLLSLPFHPTLGWIDTSTPVGKFETWQIFIGCMAMLQFIAVVLNLVPVPPLDGFNIISPTLDPHTREKLTTPPISTIAFLTYFAVLWGSNKPIQLIVALWVKVMLALGFDDPALTMIGRCISLGLYGSTH
jgi:Zn-dependent protease